MNTYYDMHAGLFIIPKAEFDNDKALQNEVIAFLSTHGANDAHGGKNWALEFAPHVNENGEYVHGEFDLIIREVNSFC